MGVFKKVANDIYNLVSFKTQRKLLVIESDDWGSLRTKNKEVLHQLNSISKNVQEDRFTQLDSLANTEDLSNLFEILNSVKDKIGNPAKLTANVCVANPDFKKIENSGFSKFYVEEFNQTIEKSVNGKETLLLWHEGINRALFKPQLHGREHLHALAWMAELRAGNKELLKAFKLESFGIPYTPMVYKRRKNLQAALDYYGIEGEQEFQDRWLKESVEIFDGFFGFKPKTFIPPAYIWNDNILNELNELGIEAIQGIKLQYQPRSNRQSYKRTPHFTGQERTLKYLVRNAFFEPALEPNNNWVDRTLDRISYAFRKNQPAIIGTHRVNFIGSLDPKNRDRSLTEFSTILNKIVNKWPDIEFISSDELLDIID